MMATILNFPNGRCSAPVRNDAPRFAPVTHRSFAPADLRKLTGDKDAGALVEWATPDAYRPDLHEMLRSAPEPVVVTWGAKLFVGAVWVACAVYCAAIVCGWAR